MIHQGEGLAFGVEPSDDLPRVHTGLDDLEGDLASDGFELLGAVNDPEPPFAQRFYDPVPADHRAGRCGDFVGFRFQFRGETG
jgi:hypothetical protein